MTSPCNELVSDKTKAVPDEGNDRKRWRLACLIREAASGEAI
jgi:hypothetical protein